MRSMTESCMNTKTRRWRVLCSRNECLPYVTSAALSEAVLRVSCVTFCGIVLPGVHTHTDDLKRIRLRAGEVTDGHLLARRAGNERAGNERRRSDTNRELCSKFSHGLRNNMLYRPLRHYILLR